MKKLKYYVGATAVMVLVGNMKAMRTVIIVLFILCAVSCRRHETARQLVPLHGNDDTQTLVINDDVENMPLNCSSITTINVPDHETFFSSKQFIKDYFYIPLETTKESLIGRIDKLCSDSSLLVVFDKKNNAALCFTDKGKFIGKLGKRGRGPEEYIQLIDVSLDKKNKEICLLDDGGGKLLFYTYSGKYIREEPMFYYTSHIEFQENRLVFDTDVRGNEMAPMISFNRLVVADKAKVPLYKGFSYPAEQDAVFNYAVYKPFEVNKNELYFTRVMSDTIWEIKKNICQAKYVLKFAGRDNLFSMDESKNMTNDTYKNKIYNSKMFNGECLITDDFVYCDIVDHKIMRLLLYCKQTGHILYGHIYEPFSQHLGYGFFQSFDFCINDSQFVNVLQPFDIKGDFTYGEGDISHKDEVFLENLQKEDNPVLLVINPKIF